MKDNNTNLDEYSNIIEHDERIRIFTQKESYGLWRKRMDGFLYSNGKYILHMDAGHILSDKLVLHDVLSMCVRYDLDTLRFTYSKKKDSQTLKTNIKFEKKKIYKVDDTKIKYGKPNYNVHQFDYKIIWTRLIKADLISKGLDLLDPIILNVKQNAWTDMWWNELINNVSFSNLIINRLGYIYFKNKNFEFQPNLNNDIEKEKAINELLYCFYFDTLLLDQNNEKRPVINNLRKFNRTNSFVDGIPMRLDFLRKKSDIFFALIKKLLFDPAVMFVDKIFIKDLLDSTRLLIKTKKDESRAKKREERLALIINRHQLNNMHNYNNYFNNKQMNNQLGNNYQQRKKHNMINPQYNNNIINKNYNGQINYNQQYTNNQMNQNNNNQPINKVNNNNQNNQGINQLNNNRHI